jgi:hypothetical protein
MATATFREGSDIRQYCDAVYRELSDVKRKIFDMVCTMETTTADEEMRRAEYFDLFDLVAHIEDKLVSLAKECPHGWKGATEEIESGRKKLSEAMDWWYG